LAPAPQPWQPTRAARRPLAQVYRCLQGFRIEVLEGQGLPCGPGADRLPLGPLPDYSVLTATGTGADPDLRWAGAGVLPGRPAEGAGGDGWGQLLAGQ
jgi:hypothetical protein